MPRRSKGPRLYLDPTRLEWVIRDGSAFIRTGCPQANTEWAQKLLAKYIGQKYTPEPSATPLIADVLNVYLQEHIPHTKSADNAAYNINSLSQWFGGFQLSDITSKLCREYAGSRPSAAARRDLETLRAAIGYWHREYGPLAVMPSIVLPPKPERRERWLTRAEAKRLRKAAMRWPHLYRFIVIGLLTGSRSGAIFGLKWSWIDFDSGNMLRRPPGTKEDPKKRTPPLRMGKALQRILRAWHRKDDGACEYIVHFNGQPVKRIKRTWAQARKAAKLGPDVTPHTLRHTRATWLMQAGIDVWEAAGALGMSPQILQSVYGKHHPDFQSRAAEV